MKIVKTLIFIGLLPLFPPQTFSQPLPLPSVTISKVTKPPVIDGIIHSDEWSEMVTVNSFYERFPGENTPPPVKTEVTIGYDNEFLYVLFKCYDDNPREIRANLRDRDQIWDDDYIGLLLDTFGDASQGYWYFVNPLGIQGDARFSSTGGEDDRYDEVWFAEASLSDEGYYVEMAIPLKILRFPDKDIQQWRVNFWRVYPRENRTTISWAPDNRDNPCFLCEFGYLNGIQNVKPENPIQFIPALVVNQAGDIQDDPSNDLKMNDLQTEVSLNMKWTLSPTTTLEATFNPDFSQVESDAAQIDVNNTFALSFPERRPFFQEGSDLFQSKFNVVYTRAINDPSLALKIIHRDKGISFGYLSAIDENTPVILPFEERSRFIAMNRSISNIFTIKRHFWENSYIGGIVTDRRFEVNDNFDDYNGSGTVAGIDGQLRTGIYQAEFQFLSSLTHEPVANEFTSDFGDEKFGPKANTAGFDGETFSGNAVHLSLERLGRHWELDFSFRQTSPTFRADNGFIRQAGTRQFAISSGYMFYIDGDYIKRIRPRFNLVQIKNWEGVTKDEWLQPGAWFQFAGQTQFEFWFLINNERFRDKQYDNIDRLFINAETEYFSWIRFGTFLNTGQYIYRAGEEKGRGTNIDLWASFKPIKKLEVEPEYSYSILRDAETDDLFFEGYILRVRTNYQISREMFIRIILQYNDFGTNWTVEPLLSYKINPFSIFYIGSKQGFRDFGQDYNWIETDRQYFMKFQYLFDTNLL